MVKPGVHIWIWLREGRYLMRAKVDYTKGAVIVFEDYHLLIVRTGLSQKQLKQIEKEIEDKGGKKLSLESDPFVVI